ncbi:hypothetical protein CC80DRAFT_536453 [Byssothecium circinans]|uniref:Uncharacterized protein n=1 Tax=Byssothecium circinans TaxID=147558 RepID=A0A6A5TRM1_9PLEO|nr:hypothetical protein CC80DRAFT_536453 [Byssothecium circinans]
MAQVMSPHAYPSIHEDESSTIDVSHLSGMTLSNFKSTAKEPQPQIHLIDASPSVSLTKSSRSMRSSASVLANSKRSSMASVSTSKSQLRHTNHLLIGMLQNIQSELETHRTIMLDIQHRVSHLESESEVGRDEDRHLSTLHVLEGSKNASQRNSMRVPQEGLSWWQACQAFARNSEPPISAAEFLRTPKRVSGFEFDFFRPQSEKPNTPPSTPPQIDDLPPLTPTSEDGENSDLDTPTRHDIFVGEDMYTSTPRMSPTQPDVDDEIKGQEVEVNKKHMPMPPILMPPPAGKNIASEAGEDPVPVTFEEPQTVRNSQRYYKGVRSLSTYKALLKNKSTEKGERIWHSSRTSRRFD